MAGSPLGPFVTPWALRRAARELLLGYHLGIYLDEIVRQQTPTGSPVLRIERPNDVLLRETPRVRADERLPALVVGCHGTLDDVRYRAGDGCYQGTLKLDVHAITSAADELVGGETASILALGAATLLLHELPQLTGFQARWLGAVAGDPTGDRGQTEAPQQSMGVNVNVRDEAERTLHAEGHVLAVSGVLLSDLGGPLPAAVRDPPIEDPALDLEDGPSVEEIALTTTPFEEIP
ncbi:hypothetical protein Q5424_09405 [Conexibacter sp. JD483]|uniref:hypothetical protein n=1 Tax=unclassified Conexibacter TaxID=2627773 RepID=UPI002722991C|nr:MULTISPECIES: hypothetical protein [unclassified Conexibacter]MDO8187207.1 hypothetical protein [Conexibacter sp. CPCC 205706]MDO8199304.1 hypothetical protein [Conexibacter sp. CPCC 205762]MDR9369295.1 hypothetical protein [Conexibacter sp. JD483]